MIYTFKKQANNKGHYVTIFFDVVVNGKYPNTLTIEYLAEPQWELSCRAGIKLFFDHFSRLYKGSLIVKIEDIGWMAVDTTNFVVSYGTAQALSEALNMPIEGLSFDEINGAFIFPDNFTL